MEYSGDLMSSISNGYTLYFYFLLTFVLIVIAYRYLSSKKQNLPPGPWAIPILGNYKEAVSNKNYVLWAEDLRKQYGDVVLIYEGPNPVVIINDYDIAVEAMVTKYPKELAGRPKLKLLQEFSENYQDLINSSYGPIWKKERKLSHSAFRKFMSGVNIENANMNSFSKFADNIPLDTPIDPNESLYQLTFNIIFSVLFGRTYSLVDEEFLFITKLMRESNAVFTNVLFVEVLPILFNFPFPSVKLYKKMVTDFSNFIETKIKQHKETLGSDQRDICDSLLMQLKEEEEDGAKSSSEDAKITEVHIRLILSNLIFGGSDTTRLTLYWFIAMLATNPDIQQKVYQEIAMHKSSLASGNDAVAMEWKEHLPYTCATINETLRYGSIVPKSMQHTALADCQIGGFDVPKGYSVYLNIYGYHHDPKYWTQPHTFNPDRFLNDKGQLIPKAPGFAPFSFGPRVCVGESVAKADLFLLSVLLSSTFEFIWDESNTKSFVSEDDTSNFDRFPAPYKVRFIRR